MPFGICSASEVFQQRIHQLIEGLQGVEVVVDDFVVVGFGDALEDAVRDHDHNLEAFLNSEMCSQGYQTEQQQSAAGKAGGAIHWACSNGQRPPGRSHQSGCNHMNATAHRCGWGPTTPGNGPVLGKVSSPSRRRNKTTERA